MRPQNLLLSHLRYPQAKRHPQKATTNYQCPQQPKRCNCTSNSVLSSFDRASAIFPKTSCSCTPSPCCTLLIILGVILLVSRYSAGGKLGKSARIQSSIGGL